MAIDFAASTARLTASPVPSSGRGAPARTATPTVELAKSTRLPAASAPACTSSSIALAERLTTSMPASPAFRRRTTSTPPANSSATLQPCACSNSGTSSRSAWRVAMEDMKIRLAVFCINYANLKSAGNAGPPQTIPVQALQSPAPRRRRRALDKQTAAATFILTRSDIAALMTVDDYLESAREAFLALGSGRALSPMPLYLPAEGGGIHGKGALLRTAGGAAYAAIKVNANFPANPKQSGLPTIQGAIVLSDARNGCLLAIIDSIEVTLRRTAAASALAARHLARPESAVLAICGCGDQSRPQLEAYAGVFKLRQVFA